MQYLFFGGLGWSLITLTSRRYGCSKRSWMIHRSDEILLLIKYFSILNKSVNYTFVYRKNACNSHCNIQLWIRKKCEINTFEEIVTWLKMGCVKYTFQYLLHTLETGISNLQTQRVWNLLCVTSKGLEVVTTLEMFTYFEVIRSQLSVKYYGLVNPCRGAEAMPALVYVKWDKSMAKTENKV